MFQPFVFQLSVRLFVASILFIAPALAQAPGAAIVLNRVGNPADGNSFARKDAVYLSGGPTGACGTTGLADGDYYFQITDPSGALLLSRDPIGERAVRVTGGVFAQYLGTTRPSANVGPCSALNLRLAPFAATPLPNREYKLWLTRTADYGPIGAGLFGFDPARSKSENFRVDAIGPQTIFRGNKFYDYDQDGVWNPALEPREVPVGGWRVDILRDGVLDGTTYTDQDGRYTFIRDRDAATWEFREISPNGFINDATAGARWLATTLRTGFANATAEDVPAPQFGNLVFVELLVSGRTPSWWAGACNCNSENPNTSPTAPCGVDFLQAVDPLWRTALTTRNGAPVNLRKPVSNDNPNASIFVPHQPPQSFCGAYANFRSYSNRNPHDHAGFLLSRQVAATILSNTCGFMQGEIYVDRFDDGVLVSLDDMLTGAIGLLSEVGAGLTGPNDPYQDLRMRMIACTNEFGTINNTGDPSSPQVVFTRSNVPEATAAPY